MRTRVSILAGPRPSTRTGCPISPAAPQSIVHRTKTATPSCSMAAGEVVGQAGGSTGSTLLPGTLNADRFQSTSTTPPGFSSS